MINHIHIVLPHDQLYAHPINARKEIILKNFIDPNEYCSERHRAELTGAMHNQ